MTSTHTDRPLDTTRRTQPAAPGPARRVRLPWLAAAGGVALLTAVLMLWGFGQASDRRDVVMVVAPVVEGDEITAGDLGSTRIAVDSPATQLFSVDQSSELVGRVAAVDLNPGDLVGPSDIRTATAVPDGSVEVGAFVRSSRFPSSMTPGDRMRAIALSTDNPSADAGDLEGGGVEVEVIAIDRTADGGVLTVLAVPDGSSSLVARWASSDNLVLVRIDQ
ncbi:MAG: SAF domain-containing protein [Actinomycetota bacterium]